MKNLRRRLCILGIMSLMLLFTACGGNNSPSPVTAPAASTGSESAAPVPAADAVELKLAYFTSNTSSTGQSYEYFARRVAEESGGTLIVKTYPSATLIADPESLDSIRSGSVDMSHFVISYISPTIKELTPLEVPGAYRGDRFAEYSEATYDIVSEIFAKYGVKFVSPICQGQTTIISNKALVTKPEDLTGWSVRASGKWLGEAIKLWGGSPVTIPLGDVSTAIERKTVDGVYCGVVVTGPFKLYEMAKNITFTSMQEIYGGMMMNLDKFNSLSPEHQAVIEKCAKEFGAFSSDKIDVEREALFKTLEENGNAVYILNDEENAAFTATVDTLMGMITDLSGEEGRRLMEVLKDLRN